jgi:hypothetical protein
LVVQSVDEACKYAERSEGAQRGLLCKWPHHLIPFPFCIPPAFVALLCGLEGTWPKIRAGKFALGARWRSPTPYQLATAGQLVG